MSIAPSLRLPLVFLAIFAFAMPSALLDAVDLDSRSLVSVTYLAIAGISLRDKAASSPRSALTNSLPAIAATLILVVQLGFAIPLMRNLGEQVAEVRRATNLIGPNQTVLTLGDLDRELPIPPRFYFHLTSYTSRDERAFNPFEFTGRGMQPLRATSEFACIDVAAGSPVKIRIAQALLEPSGPELVDRYGYKSYKAFYRWDRHFDYVLFYHFGQPSNPFPDLLTPIRQGSFFTLFRTKRPLSAGAPCASRL